MASKQVTDRQKSAQAVMAIGVAQGRALAERIGPMLAGGAESASNVGELVAALTAQLDAARGEMVAADEAHEIEVADDAASRNRRDEQTSGLYEELIELREVVTGLFGAPAASRLFSGRTPRDPVVLARHAREVAGRLRTITLPPPRLVGASLEVEALASGLESAAAAVEQGLRELANEVRESQVTLAAKNRAIDSYDRVFRSVATVLTGLFVLSDQDALAERVRPSQRRPGRTATEEGEEAATLG